LKNCSGLPTLKPDPTLRSSLIYAKNYFMSALKSISSFLASILLIAFTISSGIIIYYFVSTLPRTQMQEVNIQSSKVLSCAGALFDVKVRNCNLMDGLVLWLTFDEGSGNIAYDYSGNGNNGTLYNGPTWVNGKIGKAISFDGVDDYVKVPYIVVFNQKPFTVIGWIYQNVIKQHEVLFSTGDAEAPDRYLALIINNGNPHFSFWGDDLVSYSNFLETGKWYHLAFVWEGQSTRRQLIYVNGTLVATRISTGLLTVTSGAATGNGGWIGRVWNIYHNGTNDEVRIYNRALSVEEIQKLYYNGLENKFNITIGLFNSGYADLGNSFVAIVYLNNGTILQRSLILNNNLKRGNYLEYNLTIEGYYPSYGLIDKIMVCSNDCQGVCSEVIVNNEC